MGGGYDSRDEGRIDVTYVRSAAETAELIGSTGNGVLILAAAGLLKERRAAAHWAYGELLESLGAKYAQERWVEDGKFIMSAGVSAGIDMGLYLASRLADEATARRVQLATTTTRSRRSGVSTGRMWAFCPVRGGISLAAPVVAAKPK